MSNESIGLASRDRTVRHIAEATRNSLKENYGIDNGEVVDGLLRIIGMHPDMFDTVKMDSIIISERLNDVSIDGNANKGEKTIAGIDQETASPANKAKGHDALYREMVKMYGHDEAQRLTGEMYTLSLGISDSTKLRIPYSYYAHTPVIARIGGEVQIITLKKMFEMFKHASVSAYDADVIDCSSLEEKINFDSVKVSIEVWDNSNGWVNVSRIVRHKNDCGYTLYQTKDGDFAFVTNNHPVYMADGTEKCAEKLAIGDTVLKEDSLPSIKEDFVVDENLAYFTGFVLGDGDIDNGEIDYSKKFGFNGKENSFTKHLPENIMSWNREAKVKFICGLIDSDGTVFDTGRVDIRMMSYASIVSLYDVLRTIPGVVGLRKRLCGDSINNIIYGVQFRVVGNDSFKKYSEKMTSVNTETYSEECDGRERGSVISKIFRFNGDDVKDTRFLKEELEYVYDITTSTGRFYANGMVQHNCFSVDASKLIYEGRPFGQLPSLPVQNLRGYISCLTETIHQMSSHLAGAIAVGSFFLDVAHICMYKHKYTLSQIKNNKKIRKDITNSFQHFVHSVNMLSRNSVESPFTNISINDKVKLRKILSEMKHMFPYCNIPIGVFNDFCGNIKRIARKKSKQEYYDEYIIDYIYELQNIYLDFFDKGAPSLNGAPYRFPVTTLCLSKHKNKDGKWEATDTESLDNFAKREIYRYNIFASEGSKFASCCFDENQKAIFRSSDGVRVCSFKEFFNIPREQANNPKVFHNGSWLNFSRVIVPYNKKYYKITTENNKEIIVTEDHLNPTIRGDVRSDELTNDDYLMFNTMSTDAVPELDMKLTYEQGYLIGAFLGDGSLDSKKNKGGASEFIEKWCSKSNASDASLNMNVLTQSKEFRMGIVDGWYATDGGNSNRNYTVSKQLVSDMEAVCTSLGINTIIDSIDRTKEKVVIGGVEYNRNYPTLCLRRYNHKNKTGMDGIYKKRNNSIFFKIRSIELVDGSEYAYCVKTNEKYDEPYFTLPNGIITHNCRLINDEELMDDYASQSNSFGAGGAISLGSHRVVTINFPRIAIESNSEEEFFNILSNRIKDAGKILKAHKSLIKKLSDAGLHMFIKNGWIRLDRMFSTFGIIGIYECSEIFREKFGNDRDIEGIILKFMNDSVRFVSRELGIAGNIEQIPGESFAVRFADADRLVFGEDVFNKYIKSPLYSNQFAPLWSDVDVWERLAIDGKYNGLITGGGIVHATIGAKVTYKQAVKIIKFAINCGCEHFALNSIYSECENKHITFGKSNQCPECGAKVTDWFTRIVGFFVRVSDFNKVRREWEFPRRKPNIIQ